MNIAIDISPLKSSGHSVRGTGFYIENLRKALLKYYPDNTYNFFVRDEKLPKKIDLIHYPYFEPFFLSLPFISKSKIIVTVHDLTPIVFPENFPGGFNGKIKWGIQKILLNKANKIITDSICSKNDIIKYTGISDHKIEVVYLAAGEEFKRINNSELIVKKFRKKYNLPEKFILYVGDATWNKNLPHLIEAVRKADVTMVMVGKALVNNKIDSNNIWNKDLIKVQEIVKNTKKIITVGFISSEDLVSIYNLATLFVMPSIYEGFGLPILEAMSCGCPVITSRGGSIPEVAGSAAYFIDPYNVDNMSDGISKVFFDEKLQKDYSQKGLIQAKKFSWEMVAQNTMEVYKKVLS